MTDLLDLYQFEFFRNGVIAATLAGALCGFVGVYVVLRNMSYIGHGMSHAIFGGFAASALLGVNYFLGAGAWGLASALAIATITRRRGLGSDAVIGVITTASFAIGLILGDLFHGPKQNFDAALFGSILGISDSDIVALILVGLFALTVVFLGYRRLLFTTFDPEVAALSGVATARVDAVLMLVLATVILATMTVLGVTLLAAALVIPPTIARMLTNSFSRMLSLSTVIGAICGFVGMNLSGWQDWKSGPSIVLVSAAAFAVTLAFTGSRRLRRTAGLDGHIG
jgi:manganese/iron transport system permease protein/iron/zinc/copper transport system permease protein